MPAPRNNTNAQQTHGVRASETAAKAGLRNRRLPQGCRYIAVETSQFANSLVKAVEAAAGELTLRNLNLIDAASAWHRHAMYVLKVLRDQHGKLTAAERVGFSEQIAKACERRATLVQKLPLDVEQGDVWATLALPGDSTPTNGSDASQPPQEPRNDE